MAARLQAGCREAVLSGKVGGGPIRRGCRPAARPRRPLVPGSHKCDKLEVSPKRVLARQLPRSLESRSAYISLNCPKRSGAVSTNKLGARGPDRGAMPLGKLRVAAGMLARGDYRLAPLGHPDHDRVPRGRPRLRLDVATYLVAGDGLTPPRATGFPGTVATVGRLGEVVGAAEPAPRRP